MITILPIILGSFIGTILAQILIDVYKKKK
jgi:hypothetical protein